MTAKVIIELKFVSERNLMSWAQERLQIQEYEMVLTRNSFFYTKRLKLLGKI